MISLYQIKPAFQALLRPLVNRLARAGVSANQVTLVALVISIALGLLLMVQPAPKLFLLLPLWCFFRMAMNAVDGMLAREHHQQSKLGAYLNELSDVVADAFLYLPFAWLMPFSWLSVGLVIWLATVSELAGVCGLMVGASRQYTGPMGKSDRALWFGFLGLWYGCTASFPSLFNLLMYGVSALIVLNIINRVRAGISGQG